MARASSTSLFRVGIAGGGIGGVALALALQRLGIRSVLFERDASFDERTQGYGLTIQQGKTTLRALGACVVERVREASPPSTAHFIFDARGAPVMFWGWGEQPPSASLLQSASTPASAWDANRNCHVARQTLRRILLDQLDARLVDVRWDAAVEGAAMHGDHSALAPLAVTARAASTGATAEHRVACLVGADGIFSSVRKLLRLLHDDELRYAGVFVMLGICERAPFPLLHRRVVQCSDGDARMFIMPHDATHVMWQLSFPMPRADAEALARAGRADAKALIAEAVRRCGAFCTPVPAILQRTPRALVTGYPVLDRDAMGATPLSAATSAALGGRVTLLGDAAFAMTPFKGQGANRALADAVSLADALATRGATSRGGGRGSGTSGGRNSADDPVCRALRLHEDAMCARSAVKVRGSRAAVEQTHCADFIDVDAALRRRGMHDPAVPVNRERRERIERMRAANIGMHSEAAELDRAAFS